jgi:hypothetical protein
VHQSTDGGCGRRGTGNRYHRQIEGAGTLGQLVEQLLFLFDAAFAGPVCHRLSTGRVDGREDRLAALLILSRISQGGLQPGDESLLLLVVQSFSAFFQ